MMIGQILKKRRPVVEAVETEKPPIASTIPVPVSCARFSCRVIVCSPDRSSVTGYSRVVQVEGCGAEEWLSFCRDC
jgi:hypothetical protein